MRRLMKFSAAMLAAGLLLTACAGAPSMRGDPNFAGGAIQNGATSGGVPSDMTPAGTSLTIFSMPSK